MRLEGKVALITGADGAIGTATALRFAREGASIVLNDVVSTQLERVAREIADVEHGRTVIALGDVTRAPHVERMLREALEAFGRVDILVYVVRTTDVDAVMQAAALCANAVLLGMTERGWGRIIHSAPGNVGVVPQPGWGPVAVGLTALTKKLALECARDGVTVNCVVPGITDPGAESRERGIVPEIPMGRIAEPREIAAAHVFFASDDGAYVTGQTLHVDGGLSVAA